jgi:hypothetical protein
LQQARALKIHPWPEFPLSRLDPDTIQAHRWWSMDDLRSTSETVYPLGLGDLITNILTAGVPEQPILLH